jgi:hypothetical protein
VSIRGRTVIRKLGYVGKGRRGERLWREKVGWKMVVGLKGGSMIQGGIRGMVGSKMVWGEMWG